MKLFLNIILTLAALALAFWLFMIIREPIIEKREFNIKRKAIIARLENVRKAQFAFKEVTGHFADNWDTLINMVKHGKFMIVKTIGDPNDTTIVIRRDTFYVPILDSIFGRDFPVDSLKYIPFTHGAVFDIQAGYINQRGVKVPVFQVTDSKPFNQKYIERGEEKPLTLGSMTEVNYSGNWK